jgi:hypothetical protein
MDVESREHVTPGRRLQDDADAPGEVDSADNRGELCLVRTWVKVVPITADFIFGAAAIVCSES